MLIGVVPLAGREQQFFVGTSRGYVRTRLYMFGVRLWIDSVALTTVIIYKLTWPPALPAIHGTDGGERSRITCYYMLLYYIEYMLSHVILLHVIACYYFTLLH